MGPRLKWGKENFAIILWWWVPRGSCGEDDVGVVKLLKVVEIVVVKLPRVVELVVVGVRAIGGRLVVLGVDSIGVGVESSMIFSDCCIIYKAGWCVSDARMGGVEGGGVFQTVNGVSVVLRGGGAIARTGPRSRGVSSSIICSLHPSSSSIICFQQQHLHMLPLALQQSLSHALQTKQGPNWFSVSYDL